MIILALISLIAALSCMGLGVWVLRRNARQQINKMFFATVLVGFIYLFSTAIMWASPDTYSAFIWHKVGTVWPIFTALVFYFAIVFIDSNWGKSRRNLWIIFFPAIVFFMIDLTTELINTAPVMQWWGYNDLASSTLVYFISSGWSSMILLSSFALCFRYYLKTSDRQQKMKAKYISIGLSIPIFTFIVTNIIARELGIGIPNLGPISTLFFTIFTSFAIIKYDLFTIDISRAAETIVATIPDAFIITDLRAKIVRINNKLIQLSGFEEQELIGKSASNFVRDEDKETCLMFFLDLIKAQTIHNQEVVLQTKQGEERQMLLSGSVIVSKGGEPLGFTCILHDITEWKRLEERSKTLRLASIGELAGQLGHDLRNPLTGIKNGVYLIRKKGNTMVEGDRSKILSAIELAIEDSNRIVSTLIDYSSDLHLEKKSCTPRLLVIAALGSVNIPNDITVKNDATDESKLFLDSNRVEDTFRRIIENSIQAIEKTGEIRIETKKGNGSIAIVFSDSGFGIPNDVLPKLFSPIVTTKAKGMGMGLAICKRIIEAHNGRIVVESNVGVGTKVTVTLPILDSDNISVNDNGEKS